jgi:outer membrane protein TolC
LIRAIGAPLDMPFSLSTRVDGALPAEAIPNEAEAITVAMSERADLAAAGRSLDAARQGARAIRAERLPTLSAFADDGVIGTSAAHMLNTYTWGLQFSLPIFDGLRRSGKLSEQQAIASQLDVQRKELERTVTVEVRSALLDMSVSREQVDAARGRLGLAQQEYSQAQERFRAGVAGNADVVAAALSLNAARNQVIDAITAYQSARVGLARAEGIATQLQ